MKLSQNDIRDILAKHEKGLKIASLASSYNVSYEHMRRIIRGQRRESVSKRLSDMETHRKLLENLRK